MNFETPTTNENNLDNHSPIWTNNNSTPHDFQENHSPTEKSSIMLPNSKKPETRQRRIVDNRLWNSMSTIQQNAAIAISVSFEMMDSGIGYSTCNWERTQGSTNPDHNASDRHIKMIEAYTRWANKCLSKKISHTMILDVLCFGKSCRSIDTARRIRNGTTKNNLMKGLDLFCAMKGWA